jgi:zinc protease
MNIDQLRKTAPPLKKPENIKMQEPEKFLLDNGIEVYCIDAGDQEVTHLDITYKAGTAFGTNPLEAFFTNKCLKEGTMSFSAKQIAESIDFYGAALNNSVNRDFAGISLFCLSRRLEQLMPVLKEILLNPVFPENEVKTIASKSKQEFLVEMEKVKYLARRHFGQAVFGKESRYGRYADAAAYDQISSGLLAAFYRTYYLRAAFRIIASGSVPKNIQHLLNQHLGQHEVAEISLPEVKTTRLDTKEPFYLVEKPQSLQSGLVVGKELFNLHHPDFIKMQVVNTVLGGYFGSRLMTNIREDKGYTYGINSSLMSMQRAGLFYISTQVGAEVTRQALDEVFKEIVRLRNETIPQQELDLVKNYLLGIFLQHADGPISQAQLLKNALDYDNDMSYYQRYLRTIKSITVEEIQDLAVKYLEPDSMISVVVGKKFNDG